MSYLFTYGEALEMALRIERAGEAFYNEALERAEAPEAQELFRFLRDQERIHFAFFGNILKGMPDGAKTSVDEETSRFMDAAVRDLTLTTAERAEELAAGADLDKLLKLALAFERETIRFFEILMDVTRGIERHRLERITEEERDHIKRLKMYRASLGR